MIICEQSFELVIIIGRILHGVVTRFNLGM